MAGLGRRQWISQEVPTSYNVQNYLQDQVVMVFDNSTARTTAIATPTEGMVSYLKDTNLLYIYSGSAWNVIGNSGASGFVYVDTVYYTSSGSFNPTSYPYLRGVFVRCVGGGGAGGGSGASTAGQASIGGGGGSGGYSEGFVTLATLLGYVGSVSVTIGAGGTGVAAANGNDGGATSFGTEVIANGGSGGAYRAAGTSPMNGGPGAGAVTAGAAGDLIAAGQVGIIGFGTASLSYGGGGGTSHFGGGGSGGGALGGASAVGNASGNYGGGGGGAAAAGAIATTRAGGAGAGGICIVDLYA